MLYGIFCTIRVIIFGATLTGLSSASNSQNLSNVLRNAADTYSNVFSLSFSGTEVDVVQVPGPDLGKRLTRKVTFLEYGSKFAYTVESKSEILGTRMSDCGAFDGTNFEVFKGTTLFVQKGIPNGLSSLSQSIFFTMPFDFLRAAAGLTREDHSGRATLLTVDQINQTENWNLLKHCITCLSAGRMQGKQGTVMKTTGILWEIEWKCLCFLIPLKTIFR
jgi:hypothetical protein